MRSRRLAVVCLVLALATVALTQTKRLITEKDIFRFIWVNDPEISPDGTRVAFTRVNVNDKGDGYETSIWSVPADGSAQPTRMTAGTRDAQPRWSPDGKRMAFVRAPMKDGKPGDPQVFVMPLNGGEAWQLTDVPEGAGEVRWSPDGKRIAFVCDANAKDIEKQKKEQAGKKRVQDEKSTAAKEEPKKPGTETSPGEGSTAGAEGKQPDESDHESDVRTITRAVYRANGAGYLDPKHIQHVWVVDVPEFANQPVAAKQITMGKYDDDDPVWSRDGATLYFQTSHIDEPYYELPQTDIYSVPANGGEMKKIAAIPMGISDMALSPDGTRLAFSGARTKPVQSYTRDDLFVMEIAGGKMTNLTAGTDIEVDAGPFGDNAAPRGGAPSPPIWTQDGSGIIERVGREGRGHLFSFPAGGGKPTPIYTGKPAVFSYEGNANGEIAVILSAPTEIGDIFMIAKGGEPKQITHVNDQLFSQLNLTEPEEIWYTSFDGKKIQAWVQKPPDFDPKKKYPLILNIHGGPHTAYGWCFDHEFQWMAAKGYVVLYPNPRGSTTYGEAFGNIIQYHYPGDDYKDLMAGVDELIKRGYIDPEKLGVTGGSGGGVLTNWTVTHTNRFHAAVSQRDIADWANWWYTADFTLFQENWFRQPPFLDPQDYRDRSAITYVTNIHTPTAFILGEADYRTPPTAGGEDLFRALKWLKRPTAMVRFPGESHELSRSGQPWHRVERLEAIVGWMDKYLLGKDVAQFKDVTGTDVSVPPVAKPEGKPGKPPKK